MPTNHLTALKLSCAFDADAHTIAQAPRNVIVLKMNHPEVMPFPALVATQARQHTIQEYIDLHCLNVDMDAVLLNKN